MLTFSHTLFNCLMLVNNISRIMASIAKRDQIVALRTAGICNLDTAKQLGVCRKTVFNVWKRCTETATTSSKPYSWSKALDSSQTNLAVGYEAVGYEASGAK